MAEATTRIIAIPTPEDRLVERAKNGDPAALDELVRRELPRVERFLIKLLGRRQDLEDLVQNVFLETCRALPGFRGDSSVSTFIGGITVRVAQRAMRPTAWIRFRSELDHEPASTAPDQDRELHAQEQLRRLRFHLEKISAAKRVAFLLWALEGMTPEAIAKMTGASLTATRSRIFYAQKELRKRADKDPYLAELIHGGDDDVR